MIRAKNNTIAHRPIAPGQAITVMDVHRGPVCIDLRVPGTLFCDIDGTVANLAHRRVFLTEPKNYPAFEKGIPDDVPIQPIINAVNVLYYAGWKVVMCTGRGAQSKEITIDWLDNAGVMYDHIYTRALFQYNEDGSPMMSRKGKHMRDYRRDDIVKKGLLDQARREGHDPDVVFDDRNQVVDMWRANGIPCVQVAEGDF